MLVMRYPAPKALRRAANGGTWSFQNSFWSTSHYREVPEVISMEELYRLLAAPSTMNYGFRATQHDCRQASNQLPITDTEISTLARPAVSPLG